MFGFALVAVAGTGLLGPEISAEAVKKVYREYPVAVQAARKAQKMLVVEFGDCIDASAVPEEKRECFVWCKVEVDYRCKIDDADAEKKRLLDHESFTHLGGGKGIAIIEYRDNPQKGHVISVLTPAYFRPGEFISLLDLPEGSLESRTLIWAARRHPGRPASAFATQSQRLHDYAMNWARHQAAVNRQYHSDIIAGGVRSENVAETFNHYPGLLEGAEQLIYMWSQSSGHWGNMCTPWAAFGYGMAWSAAGNCWFGCQVFDDRP